ncbi:hypothetical protein PpBr36_04421 [Pyricularia pennisetigena]|uniref:hypothetical protein n=1 Tax=Pyricularia pennisetigena TaxID=1578925 RepID=UPI0011539251|nr:hypothetical protein PpBr36_04421 [Pyricularia pennisetigena]TLS26648.1 hypothetical protein PpBr36_04421 [Pyricularia pennisetigena]
MSDLHMSHITKWFTSSPPAEWAIKNLRQLLIGALRQGPIPRHVAFEMDGNRRYARSHKIETVAGHHMGFEALARVLEICYNCGVKVVTVYAFSIENFNRPKYEVEGLMQMAKYKLEQLLEHGEVLDRYGARVIISGQRDLIPPDVLGFVDRAVNETKHNKGHILNICFPYTSREEITQAIRSTAVEYSSHTRPQNSAFSQTRIKQKILSKHAGNKEAALGSIQESPSPEDVDCSVSSGTTLPPGTPPSPESANQDVPRAFKNPETITAETLNNHMYTAECPPLDLFIRTSGVERLSDFMLWQCHQDTQIFFLKCLWPDFDLWKLWCSYLINHKTGDVAHGFSGFLIGGDYGATPLCSSATGRKQRTDLCDSYQPPPQVSHCFAPLLNLSPRAIPFVGMKTARPAPAASAASDTPSGRRQPVRQTRTHGSRNTSGAARPAGQRDSGASTGLGREQPVDIFPGITHFADTITALPKELVRHFTLLKEVDAKIHAPQQALFAAAEKTLNAPPYDRLQPHFGHTGDFASDSTAPNGVASSTHQAVATPSGHGLANSAQSEADSFERRKLWRETGLKIQEMLLSLDEKNHVISTAVDALNKQLSRIDSVWPHLMEEFSDEAKWGSNTHWAYPENKADKAGRALNAQAERSRREGAASLSAAAQQIAEEAAARSDARKQAVAAKKEKSNKAQAAHDSDAEDQDPKSRPESTRKPATSSKSRKPAATAAVATAAVTESPTPVGLGIANASPAVNNSTSKRRKVEKPNNTNGGAPMERAMSSVYGNSTAKPKITSPRETPAPEGPTKKRKALPTAGNQSKKSRNGVTNSPSAASSPVISNFPEPVVKAARNSPVPIPTPVTRAPTTSRAKVVPQNNSDNGRQRPPSSASNKPNGITTTPIEPPVHTNGVRVSTEPKPARETPVVAPIPKVESQKPEVVIESTTAIPPPIIPPQQPKKEPVTKPNDTSRQGSKETTPSAHGANTTPAAPTVTTKSGRASKPSTPALGNFPDNVRARPSRTSGAGNATTKRSHKKGAAAAAKANAAAQAPTKAGSDMAAGSKEDDDDDDEVEITYCYCDQPSYGEMIACDNRDCAYEWFHLPCVGLKAAPKGSVKWYCKYCKRNMGIPDDEHVGV